MHILGIFNCERHIQTTTPLVLGWVGGVCRCSALIGGTEPAAAVGPEHLHWMDGLHFRQYFAQLSHLNCTARAKHGSQTPRSGALVHFRQSVVIGLMGCFHNVPSVRPSWTMLQAYSGRMDWSWMDSVPLLVPLLGMHACMDRSSQCQPFPCAVTGYDHDQVHGSGRT